MLVKLGCQGKVLRSAQANHSSRKHLCRGVMIGDGHSGGDIAHAGSSSSRCRRLRLHNEECLGLIIEDYRIAATTQAAKRINYVLTVKDTYEFKQVPVEHIVVSEAHAVK